MKLFYMKHETGYHYLPHMQLDTQGLNQDKQD